ncbi:hypothetical protein BLOT_002252 [Blomia tropicalis]|nr:hypothetical protein BLOT_002252 [Blomia tropicalis]
MVVENNKISVVSEKFPYLYILRQSWTFLFSLIIPIIFAPLLFDYDNKPYLCLYVLIVMALFWTFEPINLYMTSLLPVALFPLFGIATTDETCFNYMKGTIMMFLGGLIMGIALEHSNFHRRIALKIIIFFGSSYRKLMAGIMLATMFQSMWINNTGTVAMMIPIVDSILSEITETSSREMMLVKTGSIKNQNNNETHIAIDSKQLNGNERKLQQETKKNEQTPLKVKSNNDETKTLRKAMLLSIVYAANIGGTASLTGTGTNLVLQEVFLIEFPGSTAITFTTWMVYALPSALVTIFAAWIFLTYYFINDHDETPETAAKIQQLSIQKYEELGSLTSHEIGVLIHFILLITLWFFRYPGWTNLITDNKNQIKDATPAILVAIMMFMIPADFRQLFTNGEKGKTNGHTERLLNWRVVQSGISWGLVFLLGGGFALAFGIQKSGLAKLFSEQLARITLSPTMTTITLVLISVFVTQITSNVATANIIIPVICEMAVHMHVNPLMFIVPVTIAISFAFMFPVSTPANAMVYDHLCMNVMEMARPGLWMNLIAIAIQLVLINTFGIAVYDLNHFPGWAMPTNITM